jgi:hypothetical protein
LPYTLTINMDDRNRNPNASVSSRSNLRLGTQVPITTLQRQSNDANSPMVPTVQYRDVGTSIDATVTVIDAARFKVDLNVEDSSVDAGPGGGASGSNPAFRSFRTSESLLMRDGQSAQYTTATDQVSGEVWKVDVTLNVVK